MADKHNPIACEPCRQKKCKCDRLLPVCSQCSDPVRCIYPESGKRGLPQGYITHLETRLATTERALYSVYAYLRTISPRSFPIVDDPQSIPTRSASLGEWTQFPLRDPDDLERWWAEKARLYGTEGEAASDWSPVPAQEMISREKDVGTSVGTTTSLNNDNDNINNANNHGSHRRQQPGGNPREGRAERLAEMDSEVYF